MIYDRVLSVVMGHLSSLFLSLEGTGFSCQELFELAVWFEPEELGCLSGEKKNGLRNKLVNFTCYQKFKSHGSYFHTWFWESSTKIADVYWVFSCQVHESK